MAKTVNRRVSVISPTPKNAIEILASVNASLDGKAKTVTPISRNVPRTCKRSAVTTPNVTRLRDLTTVYVMLGIKKIELALA